MHKILSFLSVILIITVLVSCGKKEDTPSGDEAMNTAPNLEPSLEKRLESYADITVKADISHLTDNQKKLVQKLAEAGHLADQIFWKQTSHNSISVRDSLKELNTPESRAMLEFVLINYGPYDPIYESENFTGNGPEKRPEGGNFYPVDMSKKEFEEYVANNPDQRGELTSQYTVVERDGDKFKAIPYNKAYPEVEALAKKLEEAAEFADNPTLKNYLILRANALRTDDYLESDMAWMDIKDNDIDIVIGPIENYEDGLFNYKTAYEAVVMVKDLEASKELDMFQSHIDDFEHKLPYDKKYIRESAGKGNILQVVNVAYFGGDCQKAVKTIASSLPNDPRVHAEKGGKKSMFKNMMEAKFDKIVVPIAEKLLDESLVPYVDKKSFTSFVTLHEVSHTIGRGYVYGKDDLPVRKALKEKYSAIEETKADILGMYNHKHLLEMGEITEEYMKKTQATYLAGLYRSIRFGAEEAHGRANLIQLNFLKEKGAIVKLENGKYKIDEAVFMDKVMELANIILVIEAEGDYKGAGEMIEKYGQMNDEIQGEIDMLSDIPRDLDARYEY